MIALKPSHRLLVVRSADGTATAAASWVNVAPAADTPDVATVTVGATDTELVPAPTSSQNVVKQASARCLTGSVTLSFKLDNGTTTTVLFTVVLTAGQSITYSDGRWWKYDVDGSPLSKVASPNLSASTIRLRLAHARANVSNLVVGSDVSFWRGTGAPVQGAVPTAAATCNASTAGAFPLAARSGGQVRRLLELAVQAATASQTFYLEDRLAHSGGLSGTVTTAQTIGIDLQTMGGTDNISARKGAADYSEVSWYMEWYTATGSTSVTPVVNVTYDDGSTGDAKVWALGSAAIPASVAASRRYQVLPAVAGRHIRGLNSVTSPTTGTAGNFGFTATRKLAEVVSPPLAYRQEKVLFSKAEAPMIQDNACLTFSGTVTATSSGVFTGSLVQDVSEV